MYAFCKFSTLSLLLFSLVCGCGGPANTTTTERSSTATDQPESSNEPDSSNENVAESTSTPEAEIDEITLKAADLADYDKVIAGHKGEVVLVDFWALWCIECIKNFPHTVEWSRKYKKDGFAVVTVSLDDPDADSERTLNKLKALDARFDNLISTYGTEESFKKFELGGALPHYKIYDRSGKLLKDIVYGDIEGAEPHLSIELAIQEALKQK